MIIGGIAVEGPAEEILVLPRLKSSIIIRAKAVTDMSVFEALCPTPKAPKTLVKGGFKVDDKNVGYMEQVKLRDSQRFAYICIKSLEPSEIEWSEVKEDDPKTWLKWTDELVEAGINNVEIQRITVCVMQANSLDERKLEQARELFLLGMEEETEASSGQSSEVPNSPSGQPVKTSE